MIRYLIAPASGKLIFRVISPHSMGSEKLAVVGSPFWMAPEVLRDEPYNEKVSLGTPRSGSLQNPFLAESVLSHTSCMG